MSTDSWPLKALLILLAFAALLTPAAAQAATFRFTGQGADHQSWDDPANWSPASVPGPGDDVVIKQNPGGPAHVTLHEAVTVRSVDLEAGGSLNNQSITVTGGLTWLGGSILTNMTLPAGSVSTVSGSDGKGLGDDGSDGLTDAGSLDLGGSGLMLTWDPDSLTSTGSLTIEPGFAIHGIACCVTPAHLISTGSLSLPGPGTATVAGVGFEAGGTFAMSGGGELDLMQEPAQLDAGLAVSGSGRIKLSGTQNTVLGGALGLGTGTTLELGASSDLAGTSTITGGGTLDWTGGRIIGNITLGSDTPLVVEGSATKFVAADEGGAGRLTTDGASSVSGTGVLFVAAPGSLTNAGTMTLAVGSAIRGFSCCVTPARMLNTGTLIGDAGGGTAAIGALAFTNAGTLDAHAGTLEIDTIDPVQTKGTTLLDGGTLGSDHTFQLRKGKLEGVGTIAAAVNNTGASVLPGALKPRHATGILSITRSYTQSGKGSYKPDIEGTAAGSGYDQLAIGGTATLGGTLAISTGKKVAPVAGTHVSILTAASRTGTFATVTGTLIPSGGTWSVAYLATGVDLVAG
jgi:hypothetical protein